MKPPKLAYVLLLTFAAFALALHKVKDVCLIDVSSAGFKVVAYEVKQ